MSLVYKPVDRHAARMELVLEARMKVVNNRSDERSRSLGRIFLGCVHRGERNVQTSVSSLAVRCRSREGHMRGG